MLISPSKCIKAYRIRDSLIAIRNKDAKKIEISGYKVFIFHDMLNIF